ncbi:MAG: Asp23/Gls24 family envelope stress response protein [Clostridiaceae bacterium]|nr:Asp23/Gls24 family envelope stress response protein [Clostridiaceae bacterium]
MTDEKGKVVNQADTEVHPITTENEGLGEIRISSEVVSVIASNAAMEVKGVASLSGGIAGNISQVLGRKNPFKGIKVEMAEDRDVNIDLHVVVEYGARIPDVAWKLQERIKQSVESMTGLHVNEINIHVQGVSFDKESKKAEVETTESEKDV